ncbi:cupin domain-containing protein [Parachitinimonas caeni]|uniref:Cupin domain-containing protein n=1 Tax=Parachitinimonas caeni TaxID=3031301 RepID=A0ABT7DWI3_9NEIS|nr:cupin domain-containing protein [Parachitinimonas caeni]MDK2124427.1 cupin domain-containing protein [Parachitinimonas caeni]
MSRPPCIAHYLDIQTADDAHYPDSAERLSIGAPFGRHFGLQRLGIHHELLPPGRRTSWPHAEKTEEEFVYVIEGNPDVWIDGVLHRLQPGDGVGFKPGDGLAHTFINNTCQPVHLLVVGDTRRDDNQVHYPLHPARNIRIGDLHWADVPPRDMGDHDGLPDQLRADDGPY